MAINIPIKKNEKANDPSYYEGDFVWNEETNPNSSAPSASDYGRKYKFVKNQFCGSTYDPNNVNVIREHVQRHYDRMGGETVLIPGYDNPSPYNNMYQAIADTHRYACKTSWFSIDGSIDLYDGKEWANPLIVHTDSTEYGFEQQYCLNCVNDCHGCTTCNACYNQKVDCSNCANNCTANCTTACTSACTAACVDVVDTCIEEDGSCAVGEVSGCEAPKYGGGYLCDNCNGLCTEGCTSCTADVYDVCVNNTEYWDQGCKETCFGGCADSCQTCTSQIVCGSEFKEVIDHVCDPCNNCTECTSCDGDVGTQTCSGGTSCSQCTAGCTHGTTSALPKCPSCVGSCQGTCQNKLNGLGGGNDGCVRSDVTTFNNCNASGVSCGPGEVTCLLNTLLYRCTGVVELSCPNNNANDYSADLCIEDFDEGCSASENGGTFQCPIQVDKCGQIVSCIGNCNTGSFSGWYCTSAVVSTIKPKDVCKNGEISAEDPITDTCEPACDSSCVTECQGCDGSCTTCDGCTSACTGSCVSGCTSGCTTNCTSACTSCNGCTASCDSASQGCPGGCVSTCTGGCTANCASGCTSSCVGGCASGCTSGCVQGCTSGCAAGCTSSCVDYDPSCTSCIGSCTSADSCCTSWCTTSTTCGTCDGTCTSGCQVGCTGITCYWVGPNS